MSTPIEEPGAPITERELLELNKLADEFDPKDLTFSEKLDLSNHQDLQDLELAEQKTAVSESAKKEMISYDEALCRVGGIGAYQVIMLLSLGIF